MFFLPKGFFFEITEDEFNRIVFKERPVTIGSSHISQNLSIFPTFFSLKHLKSEIGAFYLRKIGFKLKVKKLKE